MYSRLSLFLSLTFIFSLFSCSLVKSTRESLLGEDTPKKKTKKQVKWVSKNQYDELLVKYKNLNDKYENIKTEKLTSDKAFDQIDEMTKDSKLADKSTETVDAFGPKGIVPAKAIIPNAPRVAAPAQRPLNVVPGPKLDLGSVNQEVNIYKKAVNFYEAGRVENALQIFQQLEHAKNKQIVVRAKLYIGDIYFNKHKYDLALQVYDSIIKTNAFSGKVIAALKKASICARELGLDDVKIKYESILKDFFEVQV